jgi:hypothetical protein
MNVFCALNSERFNNPQKNLVCTYFSGFNSFELDLSGEAICGGGKLKFDIKNMKMSIFFIYPFPSLGGTSPPPPYVYCAQSTEPGAPAHTEENAERIFKKSFFSSSESSGPVSKKSRKSAFLGFFYRKI